MADSIVFGIAQKIMANITSAAVQDIGSIWGVTKELSGLEETISAIKDVLLDAEAKKNHNHQVSSWLKKLEGVVYEADDLMDDISTEALRRQLMSGSNMGKKVRTFFSSSNQLVFRRTMAYKIKDINDRLAAISKNRTDFHLEVCHEESRVVLRAREETHSYIPEEKVIGRDNDRKAILDLLLDPKVEEDVSVLPIVGLGGLGKTTLAQFVFNNENIQTNFDLKMWVCVSENFDVKSLVEKIIKVANKNHCEKNQEMDQLQRELRDTINGKRYFLVLDDVWNEDREEWLKLKDLLSNGAKGSRILITTRSQVLGEITTSSMKPYMLGILDKDESWSLFKNVAFKPGNEPNNPNTKKTAMEIVDKCGGIPLAIRTIGSMLYSKPEAQWACFLEMEFSRMPQNKNNILPTLKLSYDNLPSHLKQCFAYCSLFPKDYEIEVDMLIKLWMAQGFIKPSSSSQSLEEAGFEIFNELHWRSFFQEVKNDWTKKLKCKMHDLMHDLALRVAGTECAILRSVGENIEGRTRHVSFDFDLDPSSGFPTFLSKENGIRTILFPQPWGNSGMLVSWDVILLLKVLRTLDLHHSGKVPNSIGKLKHLRYLDLSRNYEIKTLPASITKLHNLETLKLSNCTNLVELPRDLKKLVNLRHLENYECDSLTHMPRGLGQLSNLVTLKEFIVNEDGMGPTNKRHNQGQVAVGGLSELMKLNNLGGELDIRNLRYGKDASEEYKDAKLKEKQHLHTLQLRWSNGSNDNDDNVDAMSPEAEGYEITLESLQPHPNLKELGIFGYRAGVRLASWFSSLTTLDTLVLRGCAKIKNVSPLMSQVPCLKSLTLEKLSSLEYISNSDVMSVPLLSTLQWLKLENLPNLKRWWKDVGEEEEEDIPPFECLSQLTIWDCPQLTSNMPLYPYLEGELELTDNYRLKTFQRTQQMKMKMKMKMMDSFSPLSKLTSLKVEGIESLQSLSVLTCSLTSLRNLRIRECPKLKTLLPAFQQLTSLQELEIIRCHEVDIYGDGGDGNMWQALQSLHDLEFNGLPQLETLPDGLQQLTSLQTLSLRKCESLVGIPEWIGNLKSLRQLFIEECNKLTLLPEGMRQLTSLQDLYSDDLPQLETLPDGLQQLTSLQTLSLRKCESLVGIPEWIGNLKSLRQLEVWGCNKLTSLPEGMRQLTSLQYLYIRDCDPILKQRCERETGEDWHKVSHIPSLYIDDEWINRPQQPSTSSSSAALAKIFKSFRRLQLCNK